MTWACFCGFKYSPFLFFAFGVVAVWLWAVVVLLVCGVGCCAWFVVCCGGIGFDL